MMKSGEIAGVLAFNVVWGVGGGGAGVAGARLGRRSCIRVWRVRKSAKSAKSAILFQDVCYPNNTSY